MRRHKKPALHIMVMETMLEIQAEAGKGCFK